jgi:nicotinamide-nucleotide amidase
MALLDDIVTAAEKTLARARQKGLKIVTAESCTGGLIASALTEIAGSSDVVERGFMTYSNEAKQDMLGVPESLIEAEGAVSEKVARAMAEGALANSLGDISISVTGVAGPGGGTTDKPVGLVHIACAAGSVDTLHKECRFGDRTRRDIRLATVLEALNLMQIQIARSGSST